MLFRSVNLGVSFVDGDEELNWKQTLKQTHSLLKNSIASGPNLLRVTEEGGTKDED